LILIFCGSNSFHFFILSVGPQWSDKDVRKKKQEDLIKAHPGKVYNSEGYNEKYVPLGPPPLGGRERSAFIPLPAYLSACLCCYPHQEKQRCIEKEGRTTQNNRSFRKSKRKT